MKRLAKGCAAGLWIAIFCHGLLQAETIPESPKAAILLDSSYRLIFDDEFEGTQLDPVKWRILASDSMGGGYSRNRIVPENVSVADGFLNLISTMGPSKERPYQSSFVFTRQSWTYRYWEARIKMPAKSPGLWPAFWMNHGGTYPEIDIFEWLGNTPHAQTLTYHPANDAELTQGSGLGAEFSGPDYSADFHVYGMLWEPEKITWYIDGVEVFHLEQGTKFKDKPVDITSVPMETILNCAVGGWNKNEVTEVTVFPARLQVDYLRIYSNDPKVPAIKH